MILPTRFQQTALIAIAGAAFLAGCEKKQGAFKMPPSRVSVLTVQPETVPVVQEYIGRGISPYDVELRALVSGTLKERPMQDGAEVKAGDVLFILDETPFKATLENAKARVIQSEATAANAERNLERMKPLLETKAISTKDLDDANTAMLNAWAQLAAARADVVSAQWNLENTRIVAPVSGRLGKAMVVPGSPIAANMTILVRLQQTDPIWVGFSIPEPALLRFNREVREGKIKNADENQIRVDLKLGDGSVYPTPGKLNFSDINLRTEVSAMEARAIFDNPDKRLKPGQFFTVSLSGPTRSGVFLLPQRAVQINPTNKYVYVVSKLKGKDGAEYEGVEVRDVQTGEWIGDRWVIESGLKAGDRVVVEGVQKIGPGAPVVIDEFAAAGKGASAPATPATPPAAK